MEALPELSPFCGLGNRILSIHVHSRQCVCAGLCPGPEPLGGAGEETAKDQHLDRTLLHPPLHVNPSNRVPETP